MYKFWLSAPSSSDALMGSHYEPTAFYILRKSAYKTALNSP